MNKEHHYSLTTEWTGNTGKGTINYMGYDRAFTVHCNDKSPLFGSSDPAFRGDKNKHNPEELLVASISSCHMLWYLHLCAEAGIVVISYSDTAEGIMEETSNGGGRFKEVTLNPAVVVQRTDMIEKARQLHARANELCFIANSVNFVVSHVTAITSMD